MPNEQQQFWPNNARLCVSIAMQFEAGGQPISGAGGPITEPIEPGYPDLGTNGFFEYGIHEGMPRMLDLFDKHDIKVTSFMIGEAIEKHPELAREIVRRGHEPAAHGKRWEPQYTFPPEEERAWIQSSLDSIVNVTGQRPSGYNCYWMRGSVRTLDLLQELGFTYHIDDLSRDEPFIQDINGKPFVSVPYTVHMNDIVAYDFTGFSPADYEQQLRDEFDQLYEEGASRPADDADQLARPPVGTCFKGACSRPLPDLCEEPSRGMVRAQGRDRPACVSHSGHHAKSGARRCRGQRPAEHH